MLVFHSLNGTCAVLAAAAYLQDCSTVRSGGIRMTGNVVGGAPLLQNPALFPLFSDLPLVSPVVLRLSRMQPAPLLSALSPNSWQHVPPFNADGRNGQ